MTFLEIAQKVARESGITTNGPTSVIGQQGSIGKVIYWVLDAVLDVINESEFFSFMWAQVTSTTVIGQDKYTLADLGAADLKSMDVMKTGENILYSVPWETWKTINRNYSRAPQAPYEYTITPDRQVILFPTPNEELTITLDYYRKAVLPVESTDELIIPVDCQQIVVQKALMYYSVHEDDVGRYQQTQVEYEKWLGLLVRDYTPTVSFK